MSNDMTYSQGRFGNHIIRALAASFISKKSDLRFNYGEYSSMIKALGIQLYTDGQNFYDNVVTVADDDVMHYIENTIATNININHSFFQTYAFSNYLHKYFQCTENQLPIMAVNKFSSRYLDNNDVFVHVRLTDATDWNPGLEFYDRALSQLTFTNGYIASDDINHTICKELIQKYNLQPIHYNEVDTIMFGSTCKFIVLTGGSFSYIIGLFGFFSKVYYLQQKYRWHPPELYYLDGWTEIK